MLDILKQYQLYEVLTVLVAFAFGVKGFITFYDWAVGRLRNVFSKENLEQTEKKELKEKIKSYDIKLDTFSQSQESLIKCIDSLSDRIDLLVNSDREDIKAFIVREHHYFCYQKEWIDDYSLECLEKRFKYYNLEGGNSFIESMMNEIRALPKHPPDRDLKGE